jgi:hypothetical protein
MAKVNAAIRDPRFAARDLIGLRSAEPGPRDQK